MIVSSGRTSKDVDEAVLDLVVSVESNSAGVLATAFVQKLENIHSILSSEEFNFC